MNQRLVHAIMNFGNFVLGLGNQNMLMQNRYFEVLQKIYLCVKKGIIFGGGLKKSYTSFFGRREEIVCLIFRLMFSHTRQVT